MQKKLPPKVDHVGLEVKNNDNIHYSALAITLSTKILIQSDINIICLPDKHNNRNTNVW